MRRRDAAMLILSVGAATLGAGCGSSWGQARFKRDVEVTFLLPSGAGIAAVAENGSLTLAEAPRDDVWVRAHIRATTQERADAVQITADPSGADYLTIEAAWPTPRAANEGVSFEIAGPSDRPIRGRSSNGHIELSGFAGGAALRTSNGSVTVSNHDGPVSCETSNGSVKIVGASGPLDVHTSNGSVRAELVGPGPIEIETSNGSVAITVGPDFAGQIDANTSSGKITATDDAGEGRISVSGGATTKRFVIGAGGANSTISTSNGSVSVRVRH
ncbi:MAG: DUF4097 family beta strand repeat protein [Phycisphaerales bacterium]|nr:DUF4097 family beta strand repeat protein [Phycisphaerales bacterium]